MVLKLCISCTTFGEYLTFQTLSVPHSQKTKDGQLYIEYHGEDVQDSVSYAVLDHAYNMFKVSYLLGAQQV